MSDHNRRQFPLFEREEPPRVRGGTRENPSGGDVEQGSIAIRGESERRIAIDDESIDRLTERIAAKLNPKSSTVFGVLVALYLAALRERGANATDQDWQTRQLWPLTEETESTLTAEKIRALFGLLESEGFSPVSINKVRSGGKLTIDHASRVGKWHGPNPFELTKRLKQPKKKRELLTLDELRRVERGFVDPKWRRMFRVAVMTAMREGELFALEVGDLDFNSGTITISRSHENGTTKTGVARTIPMHYAIESDLLAARRETQARGGTLLFPNPSGEIWSANTKVCQRLRAAMVRAGVGIVEVEYKCRRSGCTHVNEPTPPPSQIRYCQCGFKLWPAPAVRPVRWYDLRHICCTLHEEHGVPVLYRALLLGHELKNVTDGVYTHPTLERQRAELSKWSL